MHDGSLRTLEEVLAYFDRGGDQSPNKSELIKPLGLSEDEKKALLAFLKSLTGGDRRSSTNVVAKELEPAY
jgi:cytochrome c peroxidase